MTTKTAKKPNRFDKFKALPKAKQRVLIAKDALAQLRAKKYVSTPGTYCVFRKPSDETQPLHKALPSLGKCEVCARGAIFLSSVRKTNNFEIPSGERSVGDWDFAAHEKLWGRNIHTIEWAYEGFEENDTPTYGFFEAHPDKDERLVAILKNIIKNKGTFKP